jgi:hypothetical protein
MQDTLIIMALRSTSTYAGRSSIFFQAMDLVIGQGPDQDIRCRPLLNPILHFHTVSKMSEFAVINRTTFVQVWTITSTIKI